MSHPSVGSIDERLDRLIKAEGVGIRSVPPADELSHEEYREIVGRIEYWRYIQSADQHYFISRVLYLHHVVEYSLFSAHQCIETYLKAYLKWKNQVPPDIHDLFRLLERCKHCAPRSDAFIHEDRLRFIIGNYDPFYELARYPVQRRRPGGGFGYIIPDDLYILDYFVYRMREILSVPDNTWDLMQDGLMSLQECKETFPDFYSLLFANNINFQE